MAEYNLTFLGTAGYRPTASRSTVSTFVSGGDLRLIVDCGEGAQRSMAQAGIGFGGQTVVFVSHRHAEHHLGLLGLAISMRLAAPDARVDVFGEKTTIDCLRTIIHALDDRFLKELHLHQVEPGVFYETELTVLAAFPVRHTVPCFGLSVSQKVRRAFLHEEADRLGVPRGPKRKDLVAGSSIVLESGDTVTPDQVLGEEQSGGKIIFIPDTLFFPELERYCQGAVCMVAEATYLRRDEALARRWHHLTVHDAALIAKNSGADMLYLNHISDRYTDEELLSEGRSIFPNTELSTDLQCVTTELSPRRRGT